MKNLKNNESLYLLIMFLLLVLTFGCENNPMDNTTQESPATSSKDAIDGQARTDNEPVYNEVDIIPEPEGGIKGFFQYVMKNLKYPEEARNQGIEGKVLVEFVIKNNGEVSDVKVIQGIDPACDEEAKRVISNSPVWTPGIKDGKNVNVKMILPITFKLEGKN